MHYFGTVKLISAEIEVNHIRMQDKTFWWLLFYEDCLFTYFNSDYKTFSTIGIYKHCLYLLVPHFLPLFQVKPTHNSLCKETCLEWCTKSSLNLHLGFGTLVYIVLQRKQQHCEAWERLLSASWAKKIVCAGGMI